MIYYKRLIWTESIYIYKNIPIVTQLWSAIKNLIRFDIYIIDMESIISFEKKKEREKKRTGLKSREKLATLNAFLSPLRKYFVGAASKVGSRSGIKSVTQKILFLLFPILLAFLPFLFRPTTLAT